MKKIILFLIISFYCFQLYSQFEKSEIKLILPHSFFNKPNNSFIGSQYSISYKHKLFNNYFVYCIYDNNTFNLQYSGIIHIKGENLPEGKKELSVNEGAFSDEWINKFFPADSNYILTETTSGFTYYDRQNFIICNKEFLEIMLKSINDSVKPVKIFIPELSDFMRKMKENNRISISIDRRQIAFYHKKRIRVYDVVSSKMLWKSNKLRSRNKNDFLLMNSNHIITSMPVNGQKYKHIVTYDFQTDSIINSTANYVLNTIVDEYQVCNYLVLVYGSQDDKKPQSSSYINLSTGEFSEIKKVNWNNRYDLSWYVKDSIVKNEINPYEFAEYTENYTEYPNWSRFLYEYYSLEKDIETDTDTIKKIKLTPMTVDVSFFYDNNYFEEYSYNNYEIVSAYRNKVTYKDISRDVRIYNIYALNKEILFWNGNMADKNNRFVKLIFASDGTPVFFTIDNYYLTTKQAKNNIGFLLNGKRYTFEQFDLKFNRPDIVLERLGYASPELIKAYHQAYIKRIHKMGFSEDQFSNEFHIPETSIENFDYMPVVEEPEIEIKLNFNDSKYNLDRYNIWINDVPLFGMNGKSLKELKTNQFKITEKIILSAGRNKIQVSCINEKGAESYKETVEATYSTKVPQNEKLYFIGIGINKYAEPGHNLNYSVKDIQDLHDALKSKYGENMLSDTLFDASVSRESVRHLKEKLLQSHVNDKVIVVFSGHGLLNSSYDYYLATYLTHFSQPEKGGLPYDDLEWLLDSIPARNKLLLIDACHSGEVDKEEVLSMQNNQNDIDFKGVSLAYTYKPVIGMKNSFELMQSLFANLNKGTGSSVISAAGGTQYAYERSDLNNGVFTYSILELMKSQTHITVSQMKAKVGKRVEELTNGLQKPTSRLENTEFDFFVW